MTKEEYLREYKKVLMIRNLQPNTIDTYMGCLKVFLFWCEEADIFPPQITKEQLRGFLCSLSSNSYLKQQRGTIDNFYKYILEMPYILNGMPYPKKDHHLPDYFTPYELSLIFNSIKNHKQRIILKLQYACALRVNEVVKVRWRDFVKNFDGYNLKIFGKGNIPAIVPVPLETIQEIAQYLGNGFGQADYLFKGQFKEYYSERSVQIIINRAMDECKIIKDGSTHLLRHSRATHLIQSGVSLRHVQLLLRHKSSRTTEIYTHLNTSDLRLAFDSADIKIKDNIQKQLTD